MGQTVPGQNFGVVNFTSFNLFADRVLALGTANLPYTVYETLYSAQDYGLASAQGVVVVIFSIAIATFLLRTVSTLFEES
jgi:ABC-type sugar transport system permease subunit